MNACLSYPSWVLACVVGWVLMNTLNPIGFQLFCDGMGAVKQHKND